MRCYESIHIVSGIVLTKYLLFLIKLLKYFIKIFSKIWCILLDKSLGIYMNKQIHRWKESGLPMDLSKYMSFERKTKNMTRNKEYIGDEALP